MKPTDEERREVARRLRDNADESQKWVVPWAVFNDADEHGDIEVHNRLADLIEPEPERTCRWVSVEERLPDCAGEYIVAYHPCCHAVVNENKTLIGMDSFMGKTAWAKRKYQRVTHWMPKTELPKVVGE